MFCQRGIPVNIQDTVISFYKFVPVDDPQALRNKLKKLCDQLDTKGTILLASEGMNGMISGSPESIETLINEIHKDPRFSDVEFKKSFHSDVSFRRMLVKVKKYIVTMRKDVDPLAETGEYLDPIEFKKWQDEGKELLILDTRNDYEVALGTFTNAIDPKITHFDQFPDWISKNLQDSKDKPIVTFCTGGIRCEKATAFMLQQGFKKVYQLEGGIIKYLEKTLLEEGDNHWEGDCVVFDKRKAITKKLEPTTKEICYVCLTELHETNTHQDVFPAGKACDSCGNAMKESHKLRLEKGLAKHKENLSRRARFLASEREKYAGENTGQDNTI